MACPLKPEQQKALYISVLKGLEEIQAKKKKFSAKEYIGSVHDQIYRAKKDPAQADLIAQSVPDFINAVATDNQDLSDYLTDNGLDLNEVNKLSKAFRKSLNNVTKYLAPVIDIPQTIELNQKAINLEQTEPGPPVTPEKVKELVPSDWLTDTGQQAAHRSVARIMAEEKVNKAEAEAIQDTEIKKNIPEPEMSFYYDFKRDVINKLNRDPSFKGDSRNMNFPGVGGIFYTATSASKIPVDQLNKHDREFLTYGTDQDRAAARAEFDGRVAMVITDNAGNPVKFDEKFNPTPTGRMVYSLARKVYRTADKNINYEKSRIQAPEVVAKQMGITIGEAMLRQEALAEQVEGVFKYIKENPDKTVQGYITGGNQGYIPFDNNKRTDLSTIQLENGTVLGLAEKKAGKWQYPVMNLPGVSGENLPTFNTKEITSQDATKLASLLIDDIYRGKDLVSPSEKFEILTSWVLTRNDRVEYFPNGTIRIRGVVLDTTNKEQAKKDLAKAFLSPIIGRSAKAMDKVPSNYTGRVWQMSDPDITEAKMPFIIGEKDKFYWGNFQLYNVKDKMTDINDFSLETDPKGKVSIQDNKTEYVNWMKSRAYTMYLPNAENKLVPMNGYFKFAFDQKHLHLTDGTAAEIKKVEAIPLTKPETDLSGPVDAPKKNINSVIDRLKNQSRFKNYYQKESNVKATATQIETAKDWYPSHPMSKFLPFTEMFNIINTANPESVAQWTTDAITLYKGADYTDLYHEAWHGFTQLFLTKEEKTNLYNETRKLSGSFTDYRGRRVEFSKGSDYQLEEWLAEDFRSYMLTGKIKNSTPVKKSLFRKILDMLKALFGNATVAEVTQDDQAIKSISELYNKLRVGDLNEYTFSMANRNFHILNKGLVKLRPVKGELESLGYADSRLVVNTLDSLVTEIAIDWGLSEDAFVSEYDLMKDKEARLLVYDEINIRIQKMRLAAEEAFQKATPEIQLSLKYNLDLLSTLEDNIGRPTDPKMQILDRGVIAYHLRNTRFLTKEDTDQVFDEAEEGKYVKDREGFKRSGNETAIEFLAAPEIVSLLRSIFKPVDRVNRLGKREYMEDRHVINTISKYLIGDSDRRVIYEKIRKKAQNPKDDQHNLYYQLFIRLGNPLSSNSKTQDIWRKFQQLLDKVNRQLQQLTIDRNTATGAHFISFGTASGKHTAVIRDWSNRFITSNSPFMVKDKEGIYLDLNKVVENYGEKLFESRYLEFLRNIGINLYRTENGQESEEVVHKMFEDKGTKGRYGLNQIYNSILDLKKAGITRITSLDELSKERPNITKGWKGRLTNLAKLESEVNPRIGHMVTNASGSTQYEISLPSSNSRVISAFNNAANKQELLDPNGRFRYMSYLNPEFNPLTKNSIWMDSVFDPDTGSKIGSLSTFNASGISLIENSEEFVSGAALADVDYVSKLLGDMYIFLQSGHTEGTRTSDRGTTYLQYPTFIKNPGTHHHSGKFYVDTPYFLVRGGESESIGRKVTRKILIQKLANELSRINYLKSLPANSPEHNKLTASGERYSDKGQEFVIFDDVLKKSTKDALKKVETDQDLYTYLEIENPKLLREIETDLDTYTVALRDSFLKRFRDIKYNPVNLIKSFVGNEFVNEGKKEIARRYSIYSSAADGLFTTAEYEAAIIEGYLMNQWIHNYEEMSIFNGDLALYKGPIDYVKRITGGPSTGTGFLNDQATIKQLNDKGTDPTDPNQDLRPYINSPDFKGAKPKSIAWDGIVHTAVMIDPVLKSIYEKQYAEVLRADLYPRLKQSGKYSEAEIEKILNKELKAYLEIKAADGQGYITIDAYRILRALNGEWEPADEALFKRIVSGKRVGREEANRFFQVLKLQYYGPLAVPGIPVQGFHKFSLLPLIPTLIKGTDLEKLHNKMVSEGIDYSLFATGSKVASIGTAGQNDAFYTAPDNKITAFTDPSYKFTDNPVYVEFLKDQMAVPNEYKGVSTFSTQLRRLITTGLLSEGVPVTADKGKKYTNYVDAVKNLTEEKKKELGFEITDKHGNLSLEKFVKMAKNELDRRDLGEHEKNFLDAFSNGELKHDLSLSPSSEILERIFVSIIEKRLVRQKFKGEGLMQVSSIGLNPEVSPELTEADLTQMIADKQIEEGKKGKLIYKGVTFSDREKLLDQLNTEKGFTRKTEDVILKYGTNGLNSYYIKDGVIQSVGVKIALQGDFERLLNLTHKDGKKVRTLDRLNETIQDEAWLKKGNNRRMITFVSPRIPGQSKASFDFCQVHEFLPKSAGAIIIGPPEWLAKKGIDFDGDKEFTLFPSITLNAKKEPVLATFTDSEIKDVWEELKTAAIEKSETKGSSGKVIKTRDYEIEQLSERLVQALLPDLYEIKEIGGMEVRVLNKDYTDEEITAILQEESLKPFEQFKNKLKIQSAENELLRSMVDILQDQDFFADLIRPNGMYYFDKVAEELAPFTQDFNTGLRVFGKEKEASSTRVFEQEPNLYWHQSFTVGMQALGIAAVENAASGMFIEAGVPMNPEFRDKQGRHSFLRDQTIYLPHNTKIVDGKKAISLSSLTNAENIKMSEYGAQMITQLVDIVKNPERMSQLGITKANLPVVSYLITRVGVPLESALYFINNPLVREYQREKSIIRSQFASALEKAPEKPQYFEGKARDGVLKSVGLLGTTGVYNFNKQAFYNALKNNMAGKVFEEPAMKESIVNYRQKIDNEETYSFNELDKNILLHYFEIEDQVKSLTAIKLGTHFDTKKSGTLFNAQNREALIEKLKQNGRYSPEVISKIIDESFIGTFNLGPFLKKNISPLFKIRDHQALNNYILNLLKNQVEFDQDFENSVYTEKDEYIDHLKNDFVGYIYQNILRGFNLSKLKAYKGVDIETESDIQNVRYLSAGVAFIDDKFYMDKETLADNYRLYKGGRLSKDLIKMGIILPPVQALTSLDEYAHFTFEREYLRSFNKLRDIEDTEEFRSNSKLNHATEGKTEGETNEQYEERLTRLSYEQTITGMALDNIYNPWRLFESDNAYALEYDRIKTKYQGTDLVKDYAIFDQIVLSTIGNTDEEKRRNIKRMFNLRQVNTRLNQTDYNIYHENLEQLANSSVAKVSDPVENERISRFFRKFPFYSMLQSNDPGTTYGLGRLIPYGNLTSFIEKGSKSYLEHLNKITQGKASSEFLDQFYRRFKDNNRKAGYRYSQRFKEWTVTSENLSEEATSNYTVAKTQVEMIDLARNNPDVIFVYNSRVDGSTAQSSNTRAADGMFAQPEITSGNTVGIPIRKVYGPTNLASGHVSDATLEENKKAIDQAIEALNKYKTDGKALRFNPNGYGQALVGADDVTGDNLDYSRALAPETFIYLSQKLFENFGYVNKNFLKTGSGIETVQAVQPVNDEMVREHIRKCYG